MRAFGVDVEVTVGDARLPGAAVVHALTTADGAPFLTVSRGPEGWIVDAPDHGRHLVSADGRRVVVSADDPDRNRLLVAQTLPTAAALRGRDLFHASAVRLPHGVLALSGPSGSGKSTLAAALGERFTDDVLAVDGDGTAYAGPTDREDPRTVPGDDAAPLRLLVLVDRRAEPGPVRVAAPDEPLLLRELLAAAFLPHVDPPARLVARLDVCARLAREHRVRRVAIGAGATVGETVEVLRELAAGTG